jgi:hypothetical protein
MLTALLPSITTLLPLLLISKKSVFDGISLKTMRPTDVPSVTLAASESMGAAVATDAKIQMKSAKNILMVLILPLN